MVAPIALAGAIALTLLLFHPVLELPFVLDDWGWIHGLTFTPPLELVSAVLEPGNRIFYRPLSALYYLVIHTVFGPSPVCFRIGGLIGFALMCLAAGWVTWTWTGQRIAAFAVFALFMTSIAVHMELVQWIVGTNDIGAATCAFIAIGFLCRCRDRESALVAAVALLFKESAIFVPALAAVHIVLWTDRGVRRRMIPWLVLVLLYATLKVAGSNPATLEARHPYALQGLGPHVLWNIAHYAQWLMESLCPPLLLNAAWIVGWAKRFETSVLSVAVPSVVGLVIALLLALWCIRKGYVERGRKITFGVAWIVLGLLPVVILQNHTFRYYATVILPPLLCGVVATLQLAGGAERWRRMVVLAVLLIWFVTNAIAARHILDRQMTLGEQATVLSGTNKLIQRGAVAQAIRRDLLALHPNPAPGTWMIFSGVDIWSFRAVRGIQCWYNDPTLRVCDIAQLRLAEGRLELLSTPRVVRESTGDANNTDLTIDPRKVIFLMREGDRLVDQTPRWRVELANRTGFRFHP